MALNMTSIMDFSNSSITLKPNLSNSTATTATEPLASLIIRLGLTSCVFLLTVFGNSLALYVIVKNKTVRSSKNYYYGYYLMNLSSSDLLVAVFCVPFTVIYYQTQKWNFGLIFCKVMPTLQVVAVSASIMTLTIITVERYKAIVYPMKPRSSLNQMKISIIGIWLWAIIVGLPTFISFKIVPNESRFQCREVWVPKYRRAYTIFLFLVNYALPIVIITFAYSRISYELRRKSMMVSTVSYKKVHKRFMRLMIILVVSFFFCFLPTNILFFMLDFGTISQPYVFDIAMKYAHLLVWFNSCLNPFIYGTLDTYIKRGYKKAVGINSIDSNNTLHQTKYVSENDQDNQLQNDNNTLLSNVKDDDYKMRSYKPVKPEELATFPTNNNSNIHANDGTKVLLYTETIKSNHQETDI